MEKEYEKKELTTERLVHVGIQKESKGSRQEGKLEKERN